MTVHVADIAPDRNHAAAGRGTPQQVLASIVDGINTGNLDALMALYEPGAAFATQPGQLSHGLSGIREALGGFIAMRGTLDLRVTHVLEASDLALVTTVWSFTGTGPDGAPVALSAQSADVLRRQADGSWRFVIDNPWGTDWAATATHPVEAKTIAGFLLGEMTREVKTTTRVFGAVPGGRLDYQPDTSSKTAIGLLRHITLEDEWLLTSIANGRFLPPPDDSDACGIMTPADAIAYYIDRVPPAIERVKALSGEDLVRTIDMLGFMQLPAVSLLSMAVKHSVHHRGQLSAYLRAMGGKVPGIYGPSADAQIS